MPPPSFILRIPQPCSERWDAMTPSGPGRHCTACAKTVVDFTQLTEVEVLAYFRQVGAGKTCGRFQVGQLVQTLQPAVAASRWRNWLGAVLTAGSLGALLASKATAQPTQYMYSTSAGPVPATPASGLGLASSPATNAVPAPAASAPLPGGVLTLRGVVRDASTHELLPGVTVLLKGPVRGVSTDANGEFSIPITAADSLPVQLQVSLIGYESIERLVSATELAQPLDIALATDTHMLMGEVVITYAAKPPMPWHPRRFFNWSKHWLTRPFR